MYNKIIITEDTLMRESHSPTKFTSKQMGVISSIISKQAEAGKLHRRLIGTKQMQESCAEK